MPKYTVTLEKIVQYDIENVEAKDPNEAMIKAEQMFDAAPNMFDPSIADIHCVDVQLATEND